MAAKVLEFVVIIITVIAFCLPLFLMLDEDGPAKRNTHKINVIDEANVSLVAMSNCPYCGKTKNKCGCGACQ